MPDARQSESGRVQSCTRDNFGAAWLDVRGVVRHFDVSPRLLDRVIARRKRMILRAVDGVSFSLEKGATFGLVGESGCGKSTIARLIVGLYAPTSGSIQLEGREIGTAADLRPRDVQSRLQMIFQDPYASLNPQWQVGDIVAEPIRQRLPRSKRRELAVDLLRTVGLSGSDAGRYPHMFSGGQRQRISIARALAGSPDLVVCDEPTSALDVSVQAQILNLMIDLQRRSGLTYLFISHDLAVVRHVSTTVGVMYLGKLVESGPAETLFARPLHPYTRMLLEAVPDAKRMGRKRTSIAGDVPSALAPPTGCAFHPRCPYADSRCRVEIPRSHPVSGGAQIACHAVEEGRLDRR